MKKLVERGETIKIQKKMKVVQEVKLYKYQYNKLASLGATLVRNSAHSLTYLLTGVKCRATSVAKKVMDWTGLTPVGRAEQT